LISKPQQYQVTKRKHINLSVLIALQLGANSTFN